MVIKDICLVLIAILVIDIHFVCVYKNSKKVLANTRSDGPTLRQLRIYILPQYAIVSRQRGGNLAVFDLNAPKKIGQEFTAIEDRDKIGEFVLAEQSKCASKYTHG